ncbi:MULTISPECIES: DNA polymerase III subunit delta [unclassified Pseudoalteromonas]|uniref:DNA polymerase III subunit delta n=1 Tax=unclassified Pseudoalteromonas TaxID=194690 RepID=UPI000CF62879|nr:MULTISPECIES: DNA polymerase III subunit delta [unclassified Pseudoalteromonas]
MRVYANQLPQQLQKGLAPFYMVFGEEPFQVSECVQQIRHSAKQQGFDEVIKLSAGAQFDWLELDAHYQSMSLFSARTLIEVDMAGQKPGKTGAEHLKGYVQSPNPDCVIVLHGMKASQEIQRSAWFKALDQQGLFIPCYPLSGNHLRRWLDGHCRRLQLNLEGDAKQVLLDTTEGNLLACYQELEKLSLLYGQRAINGHTLLGTLLNQNKFDIFDLANAILLGDSTKAIQVLTRLQNDNTEPTAIAWALTKEAQQLQKLLSLQQNGQDFNSACKQLAIWKNQQGMYSQALQRLRSEHLSALLDLLADFDSAYKSGKLGSPYPMLAHISVSFCRALPFAAPSFVE